VVLARAFLSAVLAASLTSEVMAFEKVGIRSCDEIAARYETCLRSIDYKKCEVLAKRNKLSRTYGKPGQVRTYPTPAAACLAEMRDLYAIILCQPAHNFSAAFFLSSERIRVNLRPWLIPTRVAFTGNLMVLMLGSSRRSGFDEVAHSASSGGYCWEGALQYGD
jgi:hypothetical protein